MPFEDKEGCPNIWRFHFDKISFWGCPKIKAPKGSHFGILPKLKPIFCISLLLYSLERKVIFREEKELKRSKMYKAVCE